MAGEYGVVFQTTRCPRCGSARVPVQHTERLWAENPTRVTAVVRHHRCGGCGYRFKSTEAGENTENREREIRGEFNAEGAEGAEVRGGRLGQEEGEGGAAGAAAGDGAGRGRGQEDEAGGTPAVRKTEDKAGGTPAVRVGARVGRGGKGRG